MSASLQQAGFPANNRIARPIALCGVMLVTTMLMPCAMLAADAVDIAEATSMFNAGKYAEC